MKSHRTARVSRTRNIDLFDEIAIERVLLIAPVIFQNSQHGDRRDTGNFAFGFQAATSISSISVGNDATDQIVRSAE